MDKSGKTGVFFVGASGYIATAVIAGALALKKGLCDRAGMVTELPVFSGLGLITPEDMVFGGWDIRKALKLFRKSNPPLLEWLNSPIVYQQRFHVVDEIKGMIPEYYSPKSCLYHYLHMAERNFREYLKGEVVWVKKYFYVLRPILACKWIEAGYGVVPMEFEKLVNRTVESEELKLAISELLWRKTSGQELDRGPRLPVISEFVETELERLGSKKPDGAGIKADTEKLDKLFRSALEEVWQEKTG